MSATYGYDNLYNESVNDIALMNYNKGIAHKLRLQEQEMQCKLPFKEPKLLTGGVRPSNSIVAGTSIDAVPRAVGGRAYRKFTGEETPAEGGKISRMKKAQKWTDYSVDTAKQALGLAKMAGMGSGGVNRLRKAQKWTDYSVDTAKQALGLAKMAGMGSGGKINRLKKAQKWTDYSVDTVNKAFGLAKMAGMGSGGKINRLKKAQKWTDYSVDTVNKAFGLAKMAGMGSGGMVYSPELQKALGCGSCGGAKPTRKPRFEKGSAEAKAYMASIRAMKKK